MDKEFKGMEAVRCLCGYSVFHRKMTEISICRVWKDKDGFHDEVEDTANPVYDFKCAKCGRDCTNGFG